MRPFSFYGLGNQVSILGAVSIPLLSVPSRIVKGPAQIVIKNLPRSFHVAAQLFGKPRFHTNLKRSPLWLTSLFIYHICNYTVRLLSFRTGIIKTICVKEVTLLLFSFRHTSLLAVHTDLHVHTATECLCNGV